MRIWLKRVGLVLSAAVIAVGFYLVLREQPVPVDVSRIGRGPMEVTILEEGTTRVKDVYVVSSPIAGYLDRTTLDEGEPVIAGKTVVALIHPQEPPFLDERTLAELRAAVDAAKSAVSLAEVEQERAQTALNLAESNYKRAEKLADSKTISISQLEQVYSELQLKKAQVESTKATIRLRQAELQSAIARLQQPTNIEQSPKDGSCCVRITAPIDGVVLQVLTRSEQAVSTGTQIAEIGDPGNLEIVVDLL